MKDRGDEFKQDPAELLRSRTKSCDVPEIPTDPRDFRNMSAERAALIAWMNGIPFEPGEETGCGVEECCPSLPKELEDAAIQERKERLIQEIVLMKSFLRGANATEHRLRRLTAEQLQKILSLAKGD
ncbi:hypothetical protein RA2_04067 [Roseovarius sp. A-2]|uniref:hypothetical protein n=1 Tax=Roseovarius sp. A-2 TaxID=1570360 RepID=UPI0009B55A8F|nr:hypothetical protein [Roseovarius sp. A-2]GAW36992.1 hypothetical protein RA2_04067 [Roseovarius sp. A-2]